MRGKIYYMQKLTQIVKGMKVSERNVWLVGAAVFVCPTYSLHPKLSLLVMTYLVFANLYCK